MALPNLNHHKLRSKPPFGKARLGYDHQKNLIDGNKAEETTREKSNFRLQFFECHDCQCCHVKSSAHIVSNH